MRGNPKKISWGQKQGTHGLNTVGSYESSISCWCGDLIISTHLTLFFSSTFFWLCGFRFRCFLYAFSVVFTSTVFRFSFLAALFGLFFRRIKVNTDALKGLLNPLDDGFSPLHTIRQSGHQFLQLSKNRIEPHRNTICGLAILIHRNTRNALHELRRGYFTFRCNHTLRRSIFIHHRFQWLLLNHTDPFLFTTVTSSYY